MCVCVCFFPWFGLFRWLFLSGKFPIHLDFLIFSYFSWSGSVEVHLWTCGDSGVGRGRGRVMVWWLDSPGLCLIGVGLVWSDPCLGYCLMPSTNIHVLTVCGVKVPVPGSLLVPTPGLCRLRSLTLWASLEFHHQGMKKCTDPQLTGCQLWKVRTSVPGLSSYIPARPVLFHPFTPCGLGYGPEQQLLS